MKSKRFSILSVLGLAMIFAMASIAAATVHPPDVDSTNFVYPITEPPNPFFPLIPGTTFNYSGEKDGVPTSNVTEVTCGTLVIQDVRTTIVRDRAFDEFDRLVEDTFDYYAQDKDGNVWYFGEDTTEFDPVTGLPISTEGTWRAGRDDADAGFLMLANPQVGDRYYQEFARNVAEDQAKVESLDGSAIVPYPPGSFDHLLVTKETTRFDPGVVEIKYYALGIGFIRGVIVKGGDEHTELVDKSFTECPKVSGRH
jgi:hypothetical protein